jgi:hypothetical protein
MISAFVIVVNEAVFPDFPDIIEVGLSGCGGRGGAFNPNNGEACPQG